MTKSLAFRISYYVKKVAERGAVHPAKKQPRSYKYRNERLALYKKLLHKEIIAAGYEIPR